MPNRTLTRRALLVEDRKSGKHSLLKANTKGESKQIRETLNGLYAESGVQRPPFEFSDLTGLLLGNTAHYRACAQKASDTAGRGWSLQPVEEVEDPEAADVAAERQRVTEFLRRPNAKMTLREVLEAVAFDYESVGWGFLEVVLNGSDELQEINHIPAHTMRAHKDGRKFVQVRGQRKVWFLDIGAANPFGDGDESRQFINSETGEITTEAPEDDKIGNYVIPFIHYTPLSSWYGLPDFIPAIGAMAQNRAISDFNLGYVSANTVPQYAIVVQGADLSEELEQDILDYFTTSVQGQQRATLVIPIPYADNEVKVTFERLSTDHDTGGFLDLRDKNILEVLMGHGVPPYRVGWPLMGALGGNLGAEMLETYKDAIIEARQDVMEDRINRYIIRGALQATRHEWVLADIDLTDRKAEVSIATTAIEYGLLTPAEAREDVLGLDRGDAPDVFYIAGSLIRVDDATPTPEEAEDLAAKRIQRKQLRDALSQVGEVREAIEALRARRPDEPTP